MMTEDHKEPPLETGTLKWLDTTKGYGFIIPDKGREDVFLHVTTVQRCKIPNDLPNGKRLRFRTERRAKGLEAVHVEVIER